MGTASFTANNSQLSQAQGDAVSTSHGQIAATVLTPWTGHIRGDTPAGLGDSGGGVFAVQTGKVRGGVQRTSEAQGEETSDPCACCLQLIGMCVGTDGAGKSVMVPSAVLRYLLQACR